MSEFVQHDLSPDQVAVRITRAIRYKQNGWAADLSEAATFPSKAPTKRDQVRHEAWMHGALLMLSIALHGDDVHLPEAKAFMENTAQPSEEL
ncbi:hypothetical protein [Microbispora sp. NPDC049125]|uniref:hypothetical protein n=1 Tax=Microbispora sp. NPDC049125 TaxID=3154929 RepID=UPI0034673FFF